MRTPAEIAAAVIAERKRQVEVHCFDSAHDDFHVKGELGMAAACYAAPESIYVLDVNGYHPYAWPWDPQWDNTGKHPRKCQLEIAAALILAELERLERVEAAACKEEPTGESQG